MSSFVTISRVSHHRQSEDNGDHARQTAFVTVPTSSLDVSDVQQNVHGDLNIPVQNFRQLNINFYEVTIKSSSSTVNGKTCYVESKRRR